MKKIVHSISLVIFISVSHFTVAEGIVDRAIDKAIDAGFSQLERELISKYYKNAESTEEKTLSSKKKKGKKGKKVCLLV